MNLNWSTMKKEQKQAVMLVLMWVIGGAFALYQFVLMPYFRDRGDSVGEIEELRTRILKAEVAMDSEAKVRAEFDAKTEELRSTVNKYVVPVESPLSWVTEKIYESARIQGIDIQSVAQVSQPSSGWDKLTERERAFKPYAVRIIAESSYPELLAMIGGLEMDNPFVTVTGVTVTSQDQNSVRHLVYLIVEWPIWGREVSFELAKLDDETSDEY